MKYFESIIRSVNYREVANTESDHYSVITPIFEGPLDLLLQLIERAELDITKLALAQVTDQYLSHIRDLPELKPDEVSGFLVIAARLMQIKSEALLPRPKIEALEEEDVGEALVQQLILYKRFKEIGKQLGDRDKAGLHTYLRLATPPVVEGKLDLSDVGVNDLLAAYQSALSRQQDIAPMGKVATLRRIRIRDKIELIRSMLSEKGTISFQTLFSEKSTRVEIIVTFLALLELIKRYWVTTMQESLFSEIEITPTQDFDAEKDVEVEF